MFLTTHASGTGLMEIWRCFCPCHELAKANVRLRVPNEQWIERVHALVALRDGKDAPNSWVARLYRDLCIYSDCRPNIQAAVCGGDRTMSLTLKRSDWRTSFIERLLVHRKARSSSRVCREVVVAIRRRLSSRRCLSALAPGSSLPSEWLPWASAQ